jgi:hypothetical protein
MNLTESAIKNHEELAIAAADACWNVRAFFGLNIGPKLFMSYT